ncbi:hypothetical protein BH09ACT12_BH09ACT12_28640 [soil metagenome]
MIPQPGPGPLAALVDTWLTGFGVSRQVPVRRDGAVTEVEVGAEERRLELVLVDPDEALVASTLARLVGTTDVWSTIFTPEPRGWELPPGVTEQLTGERLMVTSLIGTAADRIAPAVGRIDLTVDGDRAFVRILDDDVVAARGQVGLVGTDAVFDRIETGHAYRRRGLGTVVMGALAGWALTQGADRGILAASPDGQALYGHLGWRPVAAMVTCAAAR